MRALQSILFIGLVTLLLGCQSPSVSRPAAWHRPQREYQAYDSVLIAVVDYALVQRIRVGMTLTDVGTLVGRQPMDYYIHPDYALLCTDIGGQSFEVALRHGSENIVTAISFRQMQRESQK